MRRTPRIRVKGTAAYADLALLPAGQTRQYRMGLTYWVVMVLMLLNIAVGRWRPGIIAATLTNYAFLGSVSIWFGLEIRSGYRRRRPYWTRESWLRYLRLALIPVAALVLVLLLSSLDPRSNVMGAPQSATRVVWIVIMLTMMILGVLGFTAAIDWMEKGEPSEQFSRTRWFQRRTGGIAN